MKAQTPVQLALDLPSRPARDRDAFLVADANRLALAQIDGWPDWPQGRLALFGPPGCGKTHLVHVWLARSRGRLLDLAALAEADLSSADPTGAVAIDDADGIAEASGPDAARLEQRLFHLCNLLAEGGGTLLLTGRTAPMHWGLGLPDLASRLSVAATARLDPPDDALLSAILVKLFGDRQIRVGPDLIEYLVRRIDRSPAAAERVVRALDQAALAGKRAISPRLAAAVLDELAQFSPLTEAGMH